MTPEQATKKAKNIVDNWDNEIGTKPQWDYEVETFLVPSITEALLEASKIKMPEKKEIKSRNWINQTRWDVEKLGYNKALDEIKRLNNCEDV